MSKEYRLFFEVRRLLKNQFELIYGNTHVVDVSERETDERMGWDVTEFDNKFRRLHYRVYHNGKDVCGEEFPACVFDVVRTYDPDENGGECVYEFFAEAWDENETMSTISFDQAARLVEVLKRSPKKPVDDWLENKSQRPRKTDL